MSGSGMVKNTRNCIKMFPILRMRKDTPRITPVPLRESPRQIAWARQQQKDMRVGFIALVCIICAMFAVIYALFAR